MNKKIITTLFLVNVVFLSFGQENRITPLNWEEWNEELPTQYDRYAIGWQTISPALSYIHALTPSRYKLMEIDLTRDIRKQAFQDKTPLLHKPQNKHIVSDYHIVLPSQQDNSSFTITGRGRNRNNTNYGGIKNTAYRDASEYSGLYCPATGQHLFW